VQALLVGRGQRIAVGARRSRRACSWRAARRCCAARRPAPGSAAAPGHGRAARWRGLGGAQGVFQLGQACCCSSSWAASISACSSAPAPCSASSISASASSRRCPLGDLLAQLHQALLGALAAFDHEADLGLQPADLGAGLVQPALGLVDLVAGGVVRLADGLQLGLDVAQVGHARLQVVDGLGLLLEPGLASSASARLRTTAGAA
jgi:hypothetical protein